MPGPYPLVDRDDISGTAPNPDSATARAGFGALWDAFSYLLFSGDNSGTKAQARTALEVSSTTEMNTAISTAVGAKVAGDVLQMVTVTDAGASTSSLTLAALGSDASFTPKSTSSKIIIECTFTATSTWDMAYANVTHLIKSFFRMYEGATALGDLVRFSASDSAAVINHLYGTLTLKTVLTNASLTARTFTLKANVSYTEYIATASNVVWTITEIKT